MGEIILQAVELRKAYGKRSVLQDVSFSLEEGEILGVAGENGAGKSTLLSLLAGIQKPQKGTILFREKDIAKEKRNFRMQLGYVPQEIALFEELSGKDNLKFFGKACHVSGAELSERIREVCEVTEFPEKELNRPVSQYSGGMRRKINIGAALLHRPKVLLLDEPVANLDPEAEEQVLTALKRLAAQGTAIVYVGHQLEKMEQLCNRICFIQNGKVVSDK
ncbi:MAG: ABC transporter ATP-binding protein [Lachnospiraceae bacterium]|nr:ABC transporter ATP-binding protein [Lachnospiraceae bacterium]